MLLEAWQSQRSKSNIENIGSLELSSIRLTKLTASDSDRPSQILRDCQPRAPGARTKANFTQDPDSAAKRFGGREQFRRGVEIEARILSYRVLTSDAARRGGSSRTAPLRVPRRLSLHAQARLSAGAPSRWTLLGAKNATHKMLPGHRRA